MTKTPILLGLMLCAAALPLATADAEDVLTPCGAHAGRQARLTGTGDYTLPTGGVYWTQYGGVGTAGETRNVTVYNYNYDTVPGYCIPGVEAYPAGYSKPCPPAGRTHTITTQSFTVYDGGHWEGDRLYLDGYTETYQAHGQNDNTLGKCHTGASTTHSSQGTKTCVNCRVITHEDADATPKLLP